MLHRVSANNPAVFVYGEHAAMDGNTKCKASPLHQASVDNLHARQEVDLVRKEDVENTSARKSRKGFGNNVQSAAVWSTAETMKGHYVDYCPPVPRHFEPAPLETRMSPQDNDLSPTQHARQKIDPWHTPTKDSWLSLVTDGPPVYFPHEARGKFVFGNVANGLSASYEGSGPAHRLSTTELERAVDTTISKWRTSRNL
eukprot:GEMP01045959.1.p1 GENE.GEMP01045959.1~~GEMP01045959.1.p1  ORF type:complete len:199 (+),score=38.85 GEMP01045959.1:131-727(+)